MAIIIIEWRWRGNCMSSHRSIRDYSKFHGVWYSVQQILHSWFNYRCCFLSTQLSFMCYNKSDIWKCKVQDELVQQPVIYPVDFMCKLSIMILNCQFYEAIFCQLFNNLLYFLITEHRICVLNKLFIALCSFQFSMNGIFSVFFSQ